MRHARSAIVLAFGLLLGLSPGLAAAAPNRSPGPAPAARDFPVLVDIRAAHHPGFDRIVFEFDGRLPARTEAGWVDRVTHDGSDLPVPVSGNAFIRVVLSPVVAHSDVAPMASTYGPRTRAFGLPNLSQVMAAGDFEAVVSFGLGLMKRTEIVRTARLSDPSRFVVDISTAFRKVPVPVAFVDQAALDARTPPYLVTLPRLVPRSGRADSALLRLWSGVTAAERAWGLRFVSSSTSGFRDLRIDRRTGIARLDVVGSCDDRGLPVTVADEIVATLKALDGIDWVKIYHGEETQHPRGPSDSVPDCLGA
jgi:hypothetical protein